MRWQVRNAIHFGAYWDHRHTKTGEIALDVAFKVGNIVNIELLRGAKVAQQDRTLVESLADACKRGNLNQVKRIVELNKLDPLMKVPSTGSWSMCYAAECNHVHVVQYLVESVRCS